MSYRMEPERRACVPPGQYRGMSIEYQSARTTTARLMLQRGVREQDREIYIYICNTTYMYLCIHMHKSIHVYINRII